MRRRIILILTVVCAIVSFTACSSKTKVTDMNESNSKNISNTPTDLKSNTSNTKLDESIQSINENQSTISLDKTTDKSYDEKVYVEKSFEERDIKVYVFGKNSSKNKMAVLGSIHGDEPQGEYIVNQLIEYIKTNPDIIENKQILFIPSVNPDGLFKNTRVNANKVDLNRNFPTSNWISKEEEKNTRYFSGREPASEPETKVIIKYISDFNPELIITIHSPLKVINYDGKNSSKIASLMAKYNNYKTIDDIGYPTSGSLGTYFGKERNIPVITLETGSDSVKKTWEENKESLLAVIRSLGKF